MPGRRRRALRTGGRGVGRLCRAVLAVSLALVALGGMGLAGLSWRLAQGPLDVGWLAHWAEAAHNTPDAPSRLHIGGASIQWQGFGGGAGVPAMGAVGCAWATVVVNYLFLGIALWLVRTDALYQPYAIWRPLEPPHWRTIREFARLAEEHDLPAENLVKPDAVRRLAWTPPQESAAPAVAEALRRSGARDWQVRLVAGPLADALPVPAAPDPG